MWIDKRDDFDWERKEFWNSFDASKEILESLDWNQQLSAVSILEWIRAKNKDNFDVVLDKTASWLIKINININSKIKSLEVKKSPIIVVVKKDWSVNLRITQPEYVDEFYYTHSATDSEAATYYTNWFSDILKWKSPDEIFGKGNHRFEKHEIQKIVDKKTTELPYYKAWKHMNPWFVPFNERPENQK